VLRKPCRWAARAGPYVTVLATLEAQQSTPDSSCLSPEVFYGDSRVPPSRVSVSLQRVSPTEARVRVRAEALVDEPIVTLYLRSTCGSGSLSRRYVLLSDTASEPETPVAVPRIAPTAPALIPPPASGTPSVVRVRPSAQAVALDPEEARRRAQARQERREKAAQLRAQSEAQKQERQRMVAVPQPKVAEQRSRLKVDLLDVTGYEPRLLASKELGSTPTQDENARAQALAMWRSLNNTPEENWKLLQAAQTQANQLQEQAKRSQAQAQALGKELDNIRRNRNIIIGILGLLTLAALGLAAWLWRARQGLGGSKPWWGGAAKSEADERALWEHLDAKPNAQADKIKRQPAMPSSTRPKSISASQPTSSAGASLAKLGAGGVIAAPAVVGIAADGDKSASSGKGSSRQSTVKPEAGSSDFGPSELNSLPGGRTTDAEELFDIQEQADFFLSLNQPEQAIEVLTNHISDKVETSALAYMDLFDIYHRLGRRSEYDQLREEFNRVFNAQVPEFDNYKNQSRGLEDYPVALKNIQELWPTEAVLEVIEESIFRKPDADSKPFDMQAYRELMLLYSLGKEIANSSFAPLSSTPLAPLSTVTSTELARLEPLPSADDGSKESLNFSFQDSKAPHQAQADNATKPTGRDDNSVDFDLSDFGSAGPGSDDPTYPGFGGKPKSRK
jgi:pilus assembly protein FimV